MNQLRNGKYQIVSFLKELPATEHDPPSFAVDLTLFTVMVRILQVNSKRKSKIFVVKLFQEKIILLTVTGIFREKQTASTSRSEPLLRSFHRSLVITKKIGGGFCIINDMLHVNNLTMAQLKTAFKPIAPVPVTTGPVQAPIVPTPTSALATPESLDDTTKLRMIQEMANGSQMNLEWSKLYVFYLPWKQHVLHLSFICFLFAQVFGTIELEFPTSSTCIHRSTSTGENTQRSFREMNAISNRIRKKIILNFSGTVHEFIA